MPILPNQRHERFAKHIVAGNTAAESYRHAGFKCGTESSVYSSASKLQRHPQVAQRIAELKERAAQRTVVDRSYVLDKLRENMERAMQAEPVRGPDGKERGEYQYAGAVANRALELLGKELGMFIDRSEGKLTITSVADLPAAAVEALIAEAEAAEKERETVN
jgi:phage terminase small subunit